MPQQGDSLRHPDMVLAAAAPGQLAADVEGVAIDRGFAIGHLMAAGAFLGDLFQAHALDQGFGAGEVAVDEGRRQADGVEDLGAKDGVLSTQSVSTASYLSLLC